MQTIDSMSFKSLPFKIIILSFFAAVAALVWWNTRSVDLQPGPTEQTGADKSAVRRQSASLSKTSKKWQGLTNHTLPTHVRLDIARSIDTGLSTTAVDYLLSTFTHNPPHQFREQWWLVLNEIMEQMRKKGAAADRLGPALTALVMDDGQSEVVRDYAIQHLSLWIAPPASDAPGESSKENSVAALKAIAATITDPGVAHTSIPGTAIMALTAATEHLPRETPPVWRQLDPALIAILKGETHGSLATRTTIIQSVALRGSSDHLPLIRQFARDEKMDPSLRLSSIAALGIYRSTEDRAYLQQIATGGTRYRHAAQAALKKLSK